MGVGCWQGVDWLAGELGVVYPFQLRNENSLRAQSALEAN